MEALEGRDLVCLAYYCIQVNYTLRLSVNVSWVGEWMDGWVSGWMGGWVDGWMDGKPPQTYSIFRQAQRVQICM